MTVIFVFNFASCAPTTQTPPPSSSTGNGNGNGDDDDQTPPPSFNLSQQWLTHLDGKLAEVPDGKSFIFITDTHWDGNRKASTELMRYVNYKMGGNVKVIFGGDLYGSEQTQAQATAWLKTYYNDELYENFGNNALFVRGNHDSNDLGPNGEQILDTVMFENTVAKIQNAVIDTDEAQAFGQCVKEYFTENPKEGLDATMAGEQAEAFMKMHYYVDDTATKIRHIVLDSAGKTWSQRNLFSGHMYANIMLVQMQWLARTLKSTPLDYDVVVSCHSIGSESSGEPEVVYTGTSRFVYQLLSMFKNKEKGKTNYLWFGGSSPVLLKCFNTTADGFPIEVDFTDRATSTSTAIVLGGHWHHDKAFYVGKNQSDAWASEIASCDELSTPPSLTKAILTIRTGCDAKGNQSAGDIMTDTGINSQRFDIITIANEEVVCTRIGAGDNRYFAYN